MSRTLSPYEKNHLIRHGIDPQALDPDDETPVEYLTGKVDFCGRVFSISPSALIPRLETEELVAMAVEEALKIPADEVKIADVGTGSGAVAISVGLQLVDRRLPFSMLASDISAKALELAEKNCRQLLPDRMLEKNKSNLRFTRSNLMSDYPEEKFDILLANLPYIPSARIAYLESSVKDFEPTLALDGGQSGFELIKQFLAEAPKFLRSARIVLLEVDYTHDESVFAEFSENWEVELIKDSFSKQRFAKLRLK